MNKQVNWIWHLAKIVYIVSVGMYNEKKMIILSWKIYLHGWHCLSTQNLQDWNDKEISKW